MRRRTAGFTLIELLVSLTIFGLLLMLAIPSYVRWMADAQTLNAAEAVAAGVRTAYAQAVKRATLVEFTIDPTTKTGGWTVQQPGGALIKQDRFATGADQIVFAVTPAGSTTITFDHLGLPQALNAAAPTAPLTRIDVTNPTVPGTRALRVVVPQPTLLLGAGASGIKICDPNPVFVWPQDSQACPP